MQSFKEYLTEVKGKKLFIDVWHGTKKPFDLPFKETLQGKKGVGNDEGFAGKGFYFYAQEKYVKDAVSEREGVKRKFKIELKSAYPLDEDDVFSKDTDLPYVKYRDQETLRLLQEGYDGSYRTIGGKIEEVCVFSYKKKGFDGNKKIKLIKGEEWEKI